MRKLALAALALALVPAACQAPLRSAHAAAARHARDVLVVVLLNYESGKAEMHYQTVNGNCAQVISEFREEAKQGRSITFTFLAPPKTTGKVLEATCIRPDGSFGEKFEAPDVPKTNA
jgi:hypothetical protein